MKTYKVTRCTLHFGVGLVACLLSTGIVASDKINFPLQMKCYPEKNCIGIAIPGANNCFSCPVNHPCKSCCSSVSRLIVRTIQTCPPRLESHFLVPQSRHGT